MWVWMCGSVCGSHCVGPMMWVSLWLPLCGSHCVGPHMWVPLCVCAPHSPPAQRVPRGRPPGLLYVWVSLWVTLWVWMCGSLPPPCRPTAPLHSAYHEDGPPAYYVWVSLWVTLWVRLWVPLRGSQYVGPIVCLMLWV